MEASISLYLDENLTPKITEQLRLRGIDAVCVSDLGLLGVSDANHLKLAIEMGRVLVTSDTDFLIMAAQGLEHSGIIYGKQSENMIGDWITKLELICSVYTADEMKIT